MFVHQAYTKAFLGFTRRIIPAVLLLLRLGSPPPTTRLTSFFGGRIYVGTVTSIYPLSSPLASLDTSSGLHFFIWAGFCTPLVPGVFFVSGDLVDYPPLPPLNSAALPSPTSNQYHAFGFSFFASPFLRFFF